MSRRRTDWPERLREWDAAIRCGKGALVREALETVRLKSLPRDKFAIFASICRRADRAETGLRLLSAMVRAPRGSAGAATEEEIAEYAASLVRLGAGDEALALLDRVDSQRVPQSLLYRAFAHASCWDYGAMLAPLHRLLELPDRDPYEVLLAKVNLAAAYAWQHPGPEARKILEPVLAQTLSKNLQLLHGNALEILAQNAIGEGDWKQATRLLSGSRKSLRHTGIRDAFFVRKWKVFLLLRRLGPTTRVRVALEMLRKEALKRGHWETLRQSRFFEAVAAKDEPELLKLYFGSPFPAFKARVLSSLQPKSLQAFFLWLPGSSGGGVLDLQSGSYQGGPVVDPGRLPHRALVALCSDFYRPIRLPTLAFRIYPDEIYSPQSTPQRTHFVIKELRRELKRTGVPLQILSTDGGFRIHPTAPIQIRIAETPPARWEDPLFESLRSRWPVECFALKQAQYHLGLPSRTMLRVLTKAIESGLLAREGKAASTRYHFISKQRK